MIIELSPNWGYIIPILVMIAIIIYQQSQIVKLFAETSEIWNQIGLLAVSISNKFTELDTKIDAVKESVGVKVKK